MELKKGFTVWLTGLPGSGKTTIVQKLESKLMEKGLKVEVFDGDTVRKNLSPDLGFTKEDRDLHNKRVIYMSKLLTRNGVISIVSLISPYRSTRNFAREELKDFIEVYVKCSLEECIKRDPKGLYKRAICGEIKDLTGIQHPYEEPLNPEVVIDTESENVHEGVEKIISTIQELGYLKTRGKNK